MFYAIAELNHLRLRNLILGSVKNVTVILFGFG
jgi:hypothetical protein